MVQKSSARLGGLVLAAAVVQAGAAFALEPAASPAAVAPVASVASATALSPEGDATLATLDGRGVPSNVAIALTEQDLTAVNTGNSINAGLVSSGTINLQDSALSGFQGVGNLMMNTGHNNNLQSSLSVTIVISGASPG